MDQPPTIDPAAARRWAHVARSASHSAWLHEEVARRMADRLSWIRIPVQHWVHWEPVWGGRNADELLMQQYPRAECFELSAEAMADAQPEAPAGWWNRLMRRSAAARRRRSGPQAPEEWAQLVWANMQLHHAADPRALMRRWLDALAPDGFLMFSCLGVDTLRELRGLYAELGWPPPAQDFTDMHDWGDQLFRVGFADPIVDMEHITLTFETPARLLAELRALGRNLHPDRPAGWRTPRWRARLEAAIDARLRPSPRAPLELTFEIIYGHAIKPQLRLSRRGPAPRIDFSSDS